MAIEGSRRRLLYTLNSRWIYGKVPLLHAAIFLLQMAAVSLLTRKFNSYYASRPGKDAPMIRRRGKKSPAMAKY